MEKWPPEIEYPHSPFAYYPDCPDSLRGYLLLAVRSLIDVLILINQAAKDCIAIGQNR